MQLDKLIKIKNLSMKEAADQIGISPSTLSNYIHKRREPRPKIRKKIIAWSKGNITVNELLLK